MQMALRKFSVIVTQDEEGMYMAQVPTLQGCHTQADNLSDLYERIKEAIELCMETEKSNQNMTPHVKFIELQQIEVNI